jgi:putative ABC transport system permease protein
MAFGLTIMAMLVVVMLRTELITTWEETVPEEAPNHFVLNIQNQETEAFEQFVETNQIRADRLYPVVRGRLIRINDSPVTEHVSKEDRNDESLNRELNLTWSSELPVDNELVEGRWWREGDSGKRFVSVESELAERLDISPGDNLTFFTGDRNWNAEVTSVRTVEWDNFKPNFYMVFNPGALDDLPTSWIGSFFLDEQSKPVLVEMMRQFPSITLLEVDAILNQVKSIIGQVILAVESILLFVLAAGFVVTLSAIQSSMNQRLLEGALVRTLGAGRRLLRINQWSEFASMGLLAGLVGVVGAELVIALLYWRIFELDYMPTWWAWLLVPPLSALLIGLAGNWSSRQVLAQPPITILRETGA